MLGVFLSGHPGRVPEPQNRQIPGNTPHHEKYLTHHAKLKFCR